jgi:hypothetical protein
MGLNEAECEAVAVLPLWFHVQILEIGLGTWEAARGSDVQEFPIKFRNL